MQLQQNCSKPPTTWSSTTLPHTQCRPQWLGGWSNIISSTERHPKMTFPVTFFSLDPMNDVLGQEPYLPRDTPIHSCFTSSPLPAGSTVQSSPSASHPPGFVLAAGFLLPPWCTAAKREPKPQELQVLSIELFKKGSEQEKRRVWWSVSEDAMVRRQIFQRAHYIGIKKEKIEQSSAAVNLIHASVPLWLEPFGESSSD